MTILDYDPGSRGAMSYLDASRELANVPTRPREGHDERLRGAATGDERLREEQTTDETRWRVREEENEHDAAGT